MAPGSRNGKHQGEVTPLAFPLGHCADNPFGTVCHCGHLSDSQQDRKEEKPQERQTEKPPKAKPSAEITCTKCGVKIEPVIAKTGKTMTAQEISDFSRKKFGQCLCPACQKIENERAKA